MAKEASVDEMAAYHDHNWGRWYWGDDAGWEWGGVPVGRRVRIRLDPPHGSGPSRGRDGPLRAVVGGRARSFHPRTVEAVLGGALREPASRGPGAMPCSPLLPRAPPLPSRVRLVADDGYDRVELEARLAHAAADRGRRACPTGLRVYRRARRRVPR